MEAGKIRSTARPLFAFGMIPKGPHHFPALSVISRAEKAARERSAPNDARFVDAARLQPPNASRTPIQRPPPHIVLLIPLRLRRIRGGGNLFPTRFCRAVKLHAKMTMVESSIKWAAATIGEGD